MAQITMKIWYFLVDILGNAYKESTPDTVTVQEDAMVVDVRKAIKIENNDILPNTSPGQLIVYKSKQDIGNETFIIKLSTPANGFGKEEETSLFLRHKLMLKVFYL